MTALGLLLCVGATLRLWRLWIDDDITEGLRRRVENLIGRLEDKAPKAFDWFFELIYCPWCFGFYISVAVVGSYLAVGDTWPWLLIAGALTVNAAMAWSYPRLEK